MPTNPTRPNMSRAARLRMVERAIRDHPWTQVLTKELASKAGCHPRTIRRDREVVMDYLQDMGTREERRVDFLLGLQRDRRSAREAGKWSAVSTMRSLECRVCGLDVPPPEPQEDGETGGESEDHLAVTLREVRRMRMDAQSRGSLVAAEKLLGREIEIMTMVEAREQERRSAEALAQDDDQILANFAGAVEQLPDVLVERLAEALRDRLQR